MRFVLDNDFYSRNFRPVPPEIFKLAFRKVETTISRYDSLRRGIVIGESGHLRIESPDAAGNDERRRFRRFRPTNDETLSDRIWVSKLQRYES